MRLDILLWLVATATTQLESGESYSTEHGTFNDHFLKNSIKSTVSFYSKAQGRSTSSTHKIFLFLKAVFPKLEYYLKPRGSISDYQLKGPPLQRLARNARPIPKRQAGVNLIENKNTSSELKAPYSIDYFEYAEVNGSNLNKTTAYNKDEQYSPTIATTSSVSRLTVMAAQMDQFMPSATDVTETTNIIHQPGYMSSNSENEIGSVNNVTAVGSVDGEPGDTQVHGLTKAQIIAIVTCLSLVGIVFLVAATWRIRNYCKKLREEGLYQNRRNMKRINSSEMDCPMPEMGPAAGNANQKEPNTKMNERMLAEIDEFGEDDQMMHPLINQSNETSTISPTPISAELKPLISTSSPSSYHSRFDGLEAESELNDYDYQMPEYQYFGQDNISSESDEIPGTPHLAGLALSDSSIASVDNPSYCYGNQTGYFFGTYGYQYNDVYSLECLDSGYITNPCQCADKSDLLSLPSEDSERHFFRGNFENSFRWSARSPRSSLFGRFTSRERKISNSSTHSLPNKLEMGAEVLDMDGAGIPLLNIKKQSGSLPIDLSSITPDILAQMRQTGKNFFDKETMKSNNPIKFERLQEDGLQTVEPLYLSDNDETLLMESDTYENEEL